MSQVDSAMAPLSYLPELAKRTSPNLHGCCMSVSECVGQIHGLWTHVVYLPNSLRSKPTPQTQLDISLKA